MLFIEPRQSTARLCRRRQDSSKRTKPRRICSNYHHENNAGSRRRTRPSETCRCDRRVSLDGRHIFADSQHRRIFRPRRAFYLNLQARSRTNNQISSFSSIATKTRLLLVALRVCSATHGTSRRRAVPVQRSLQTCPVLSDTRPDTRLKEPKSHFAARATQNVQVDGIVINVDAQRVHGHSSFGQRRCHDAGRTCFHLGLAEIEAFESLGHPGRQRVCDGRSTVVTQRRSCPFKLLQSVGRCRPARECTDCALQKLHALREAPQRRTWRQQELSVVENATR